MAYEFLQFIIISMLFLLLCLLPFCNSQVPPPEEIEYVLNFESPIYAFGEESLEFVDTSAISVERYNESTAFMHGSVVLLKGLENQAIMEIILQKEANGRFEVLFSHDICDLCKEMGSEDSEYRKYLKYFGFPTECPIEAGAYQIKDFSLDTEDLEISSQHAGRYEAQLNIYVRTGEDCKMDRELKCILKMDLVVEPE